MTTKRINILAGTILGGALLLGTAGLAFAQDPTADPSPAAVPGMSGGMMSGGMSGGRAMTGGGAMSGGMMSRGAMSGGMMNGQGMDSAQMAAMHASMGQDGTCDPALMQSMHQQYQPTR